jgi:hypothetical protein
MSGADVHGGVHLWSFAQRTAIGAYRKHEPKATLAAGGKQAASATSSDHPINAIKFDR